MKYPLRNLYSVAAVLLFPVILLAQEYSTSLVIPPSAHAPLRKATGTHLFMAVGFSTKVNNPQGTSVTKLIAQDDTTTKEDDDELTVYGVNAGNNEIIYNTSLINIEIYRGESGRKVTQLNAPRGITSNEFGDVYLADMGNRRVVSLFNRKGKQLEYVRESRPDSPDFSPFDLTISTNGIVFVTDSLGAKVWRWDPTLEKWTSFIHLVEKPLGIVMYDKDDRWAYYNHSRLGIITHDGRRVLITDMSGRRLAEYKPQEKESRFRYIAVDYYGNFYMTDAGLHRIVKIDRDGQFLDEIGGPGKDDYEFLSPQGIAIWKRFGQVCVAESYAAQYYLIGTSIKEAAARTVEDKIEIGLTLTEKARVTLDLEQNGELVHQFLDNWIISQGKFSRQWSIPDSLNSGKYELSIHAQPYYSSTKYFTAEKTITWNYQE